MSYTSNKNKSSQSSRGARGARGRGGRGRGRGRGGRRNRNYTKPKPQAAPKYEGPLIGSSAYHALHNQITPHNFDSVAPVPREFMPIMVKSTNRGDEYILDLQQEMMDNGWRLNSRDNDEIYFTHPTYNGEEFSVYSRVLDSGKQVYIPMVPREEDPKGLGCTFVLTPGAGYGRLETNRWHSYWDDRQGQRRASYLDYLDRRQEKRRTIMEMAKTDPSVIVWNKDTPRCDPRTWGHQTMLNTSTEIY